MFILSILGCVSAPPAEATPTPQTGSFAITGIQAFGHDEPADILIQGGRFETIGANLPVSTTTISGTDRWMVPAFIDSHVHVVYLPVATELTNSGVAAVVDLAAPESIFDATHGRLRVIASGPMVTAIRGYPTQSWGADGYGIEVADANEAKSAVESHHALGAGVIKIPLNGTNQLDAASLSAAVSTAHSLGLKVASHAVSDEAATEAHAAGIDILAHTPTTALSDATLSAWGNRAVISTLVAFGNGNATQDNLRAIRERGGTILYGTDLGNSRVAGIDPNELTALLNTGMSPSEVIASGTSVPAAYWGLDDLGKIAPGFAASFLIVDEDPTIDPTVLSRPIDVYIDGVRVGP